MNLAAANPGQRVGDGPADWVANFAFWFRPVLPVSIAIVFASRRRHLFVFVAFERIFGFKFSETKTVLFQNSVSVFVLRLLENLHAKLKFYFLSNDFLPFDWFELSEFGFL